MKNCTYTLKTKNGIIQFNSELELNKYIQDNINNLDLNLDDAIYSLPLNKETLKITNILDNITANSVKSNYNVMSFLEMEHLINGEKKLLIPEYRLEERKENTFKQWQPKNLDKSRIQFEVEFDELLKEEEKNLKFGKLIHRLVRIGLTDGIGTKHFSNALLTLNTEEFNDIISNKELIPEELIEIQSKARSNVKKLVTQIVSKLESIYNIKNNNGKLYSEFRISGIDHLGSTLTGQIDIIGVNEDGSIDLYDIKLSKDLYTEWDSAKRNHTMEQMMIYRQMLAQHGLNGTKINLYTIPIKYNSGDIDNLTNIVEIKRLDNFNSSASNYINYNGQKSNELKILLPATINENDIDIDKTNDEIDDTLKQVFPKYNFRTQLESRDYEESLKVALKRQDANGEYRFYNELLYRDETGFKTQEALEKRLHEYIQERNSIKNEEIAKAKDILTKTINSNKNKSNEEKIISADLFSRYTKNKPNVKVLTNNIFEKYLKNEDWSVINSKILLNAGIIGFEHINGNTEFIILTVNHLNVLQELGKGNTILGKFFSNNDVKVNKFRDVLDATNANIELMKALITINSLSDIFTDSKKLSSIKVMNYLTGEVQEENLSKLMDNFSLLTSQLKDYKNNFDKTIKVSNVIDTIEDSLYEIFEKSDNPLLKNMFINEETDELKLSKIERLEKLRDRLLEAFPQLSKNFNEKRDFLTQEEKILFLISNGISYYKNINFYNDYAIANIGFTFSDLVDWIKAPFSYKESPVDSKGRRKTGILGGLLLASTDTLPSKDLKNIYQFFNAAMQEQRDLFNPKMAEITTMTKNWQKELGKSELYMMSISGTYNINKNLYKTINVNGKEELDPELLFKNPFEDIMNPTDSEYLKYMLWQINKWKIKELSQEQRKLDYKEAYKLESVVNAMKKSNFFEVPLEKGLMYGRLKGMTSVNMWNSIKEKASDMKDWFDKREITSEQTLDIKHQVKNYNYMSNRFKMSSQTRQKMLKNHESNYWEINLDKIVLDYEMEHIRENAINKVLPTINSALIVMQFYANQSGQDISNAMDYFFKQTKAAIFDESLINEELEDPMKAINVLKKIFSISALAFRPSMLIKETTVGTFTNVIRAATKVYGENSFNLSHLTKAYNIMLGMDKKFSRDFNLINGIDFVYGISNMDVGQIVKRGRADRNGVTAGLNQMMFKTSTASDYWNRMTLFLAQMIKDGCYDAHSIGKDGNLIYDFNKDKRFDEYIKNRYNKEYTSENFLKQKSLYYTLINQMRIEGVKNKNGELIKFGDDLPKAYSSQDRESLKSFADMAYGYYDHEKKSLINHMAFGNIFMQFMTYWTAKWKTWTIKPGTETAQGKFVDKYIQRDGQNIPVYLKEEYDDEGNLIDVYETTETDGTLSQAQEWQGTYMEGLMWSLLHTIRDITHLRFTDLVNNKQQLARTALALHDILLAFLGIYLAKLLFTGINEERGIDTKNKNSKKTLVDNTLLTSESILLRSLNEFNPISNTVGSIRLTPAFISFSQKAGGDLLNVLSGDKEVYDYLRKYVRSMEMLPSGH